MEENVLLTNIATVLTKDLLIDQTQTICIVPKTFPLLEMEDDDEDEAFKFCLKQQKGKKPQKRANLKNSTIKLHKNKAATTKWPNDIEKQRKKKVTLKAVPTKMEINLLNRFGPLVFEGFLHMSKMSFLKIFQSMRHLLDAARYAASVTPQTAFSLALWKLTTDEDLQETALKFHISAVDCHAIIRQFWQRISNTYETFITWPHSTALQTETLQGFQAQPCLRLLRRLFGVVAITQFDILLEGQNALLPVIVQIVCNADQKIIDCHVERASIYSFDASPIGRTLELNAQVLPEGSYLVGDDKLPLKSYLMRPFNKPCSGSKNFNQMLEPAISIGKQVLDAMAKRFNVLYALQACNLNEVRQIVETVCSLHNLCADLEDDYVERQQNAIKSNNSTASITNIHGSESNEAGQQRRKELMTQMLSI